MTAHERLVDALTSAGCKVSNGGRASTCPAHDDHNASLSISLRDDRTGVVVNCHAGCTTEDVTTTIGMTTGDLFDEPKKPSRDSRPVEVARYHYVDEDGTVLYSKVRLEPKTFRQCRQANGRTVWSLGDTRRVLYNLPAVAAATAARQPVYLCEGEKDADTLTRAGVAATTWTEGAWRPGNHPKWRQEYTRALSRARVVIVRDRDEPGRHTAATIASTLSGVAASVDIVEPVTGKDAADHIAAGQGVGQLQQVDDEMKDPSVDEFGPGPEPLDVVTASAVTLRRVRYLWDQRIPVGAPTLMPGEEGIGKTTVGIRVMADLTRGTLPGEFHGTPRDVIVMATEDGIEDVFVPRLQEAGADLTRVHIIRARVGLDGDKHTVIVPRDLSVIGDLVREHDAALVWIDSLVTTLPDELKSISYKDTAKVLRRLGDWAGQERVAVVAPWHLNKASGSDTAVRIMDSRAFRTAVRSMLLVVPDPDAPEGVTRGIVALDKANAGSLDVPGLRYELRSSPYEVEELDEETGQVVTIAASCGVADWIGEVDGDGRQLAREALAPKIEKQGGPRQWLREYLQGEGEATRSDVMDAAADEGFSVDSMKRAARALSVHSREETGQENGRPFRRAVWSLPSRAGADTQSVHPHPTAPTAPTGEGSTAPTTTTWPGEAQSVQSGRSVDGCTHWEEGAPTENHAPVCGYDGCPDPPRPGRAMCALHFTYEPAKAS